MRANELIAWNLRRVRVERGLSQEALAVDAGIDRTYVSRLERVLENPTVAVLERLALALDIEIAELLRLPRQGERRPSLLPKGRHPIGPRTRRPR